MTTQGKFSSLRLDPGKPLPLYAQLAQAIGEKISWGQLKNGEKLPSEPWLSQHLGVSRTSVRKAFDLLESQNFIRRKHGLGSFVQANQERGLIKIDEALPEMGSSNKTVALLVPSLENEIYPSIADGVRETLARQGFSVVLGNTHSDQERELALLQSLSAQEIHGLIIEPTHARFDIPGSKIFQALAAWRYPCVLLNNNIPGLDLARVAIDELGGGKLATEALIALGHKRIAYIYKDSVIAAIERRAGYRSALAHAGISYDSSLELAFQEADEANVPAEYLTRQLLKLPHPPSAIFYYNDETAIGALPVIASAGLRIPGDLSVVAADNTHSAQNLYQLTSLEHPKRLLGRWAADILVDQILMDTDKIKRQITIHPNLIVRASIGKCAK